MPKPIEHDTDWKKNQDIVAQQGARVTLANGDDARTVDLYSPDGLNLITQLWVKLAAEYRLMHEPTWLGIPIVQLPPDIVVMQELIWRIQPDVIVECGVAHGGSAVLYASILELIGAGTVLGVDVEIRAHNRVAIEGHPMSKRIDLIEGSSIDPETFEIVRQKVDGAQSVMVVLDSNHSREHVRRELELYSDLVTPGSYLVAMDGAQAYVWDIPRGKPEWKDDHPLEAIHDFLAGRSEFEIDSSCTRMQITSCPDGFLRRLTAEEVDRG